ncbi:MAG TPA: hypothetical protein VIL49_03095, partial [Capillimicrobium sp.]
IEQLVIRGAADDWSTARDEGLLEQREDRHMSISHLELDAQGWAELTAEVDDLLRRAHAKQAAAKARLAEGGTGGARVATSLALMHFPSKPVI